jgi:hydrogenase maturation protein HypF
LLPHGKEEASLILRLLQNPQEIPKTTGLGRVLDAAAAVLDICQERTYEGEAAMKLESVAMGGKDTLGLEPIFRGDILDTTELLMSVYENRDKISLSDLAFSIHAYLAKGLAALALAKAAEYGVGTVGFTGGAAVNYLLAVHIREVVESAGLRFLVHEAVPAGDGGVSLGQAVVGAF